MSGIRELAAYFAKPSNHTDRDTSHVSRDELVTAAATLQGDAGNLATALSLGSDGYEALRDASREGWLNDRQVSVADLNALAAGRAARGVSERVATITTAYARTGDAGRRVAVFAKTEAQSSYANGGQTRALLSMSSPAVAKRYVELGQSGISFGAYDNASLVRFLLARGGPAVVARYRELLNDNSFGSYDGSGVVRALLAAGPSGSLERFRELSKSSAGNYGAYVNSGVVRAILATSPADATERFMRLDANEFGAYDGNGLARAIIATGPEGSLERFRTLAADRDTSFGGYDRAWVVRAQLAVEGHDAIERYRAVQKLSTSFGSYDLAGPTAAHLAIGGFNAAVPVIPAPEDDDE